MTKNLHLLRTLLSETEILSTTQAYLLKGGDGDDKRREGDGGGEGGGGNQNRGCNGSNGSNNPTGTTGSTGVNGSTGK